MNKKVEWGVLGVAGIAVNKVIPAMQRGEWSQILAIASRDLTKAQQIAEQLGIRKAYGSYEEMLADPDIEAVYNPLPNHLHVPWSIKAAEAGKHVLCEKPISLTVEEAMSLLKTRDRTGVKVEEAFMVRTHPQWVKAIDNGFAPLTWSGQVKSARSGLSWDLSATTTAIRKTFVTYSSMGVVGLWISAVILFIRRDLSLERNRPEYPR